MCFVLLRCEGQAGCLRPHLEVGALVPHPRQPVFPSRPRAPAFLRVAQHLGRRHRGCGGQPGREALSSGQSGAPREGALTLSATSTSLSQSGTTASHELWLRTAGGGSHARGRSPPLGASCGRRAPLPAVADAGGRGSGPPEGARPGASLLLGIPSSLGRTEAGPEGSERPPERAGQRPQPRRRGRPATFPATPSPTPPARPCAPGSASENKALRLQPKVKVHRERLSPPDPGAIAFLQINRQ